MKSEHPYTVQHLQSNFHGYADWDVYAVRDAHNHCLAQVGMVDRATSPNNKDNAQLFAAAPQLLEALVKCENVIGMARLEGKLSDNALSLVNEALVAARQVLDLVRGGQP